MGISKSIPTNLSLFKLQVGTITSNLLPFDDSPDQILLLTTPRNQTVHIDLKFREKGWSRTTCFSFIKLFQTVKTQMLFAQAGVFDWGNLSLPSNASLNWIFGNYKSFVHFRGQSPETCVLSDAESEGTLTHVPVTWQICSNFSLFKFNEISGHSNKYYIHFCVQKPAPIFSLNPQNKVWSRHSWIDASRLCARVGGSLPYFTSRDEVEQLLALYKFVKLLPHTDTIYIGLKWKQHHHKPWVRM